MSYLTVYFEEIRPSDPDRPVGWLTLLPSPPSVGHRVERDGITYEVIAVTWGMDSHDPRVDVSLEEKTGPEPW